MGKSGSYVLYGVSERDKIISDIVDSLGAEDSCFDLRLILTEGLTNAYKHGNEENPELPIYLRYFYEPEIVTFEIEDSGTACGEIKIIEEISSENLLEDSGRGLFLIKCYCDEVKMINNILIMQKHLYKSAV
ncbi:ATP-binding protein [Candidatus Clostridium stratigraminis]|uniref:ATP-binding protein n=1 Tax=Candidatus Clostridium stratigraminis TaxID=3381661 RepID=A0ABW8T2Y8_9CLOT